MECLLQIFFWTSLEADDGKFQPTAASEIAKWILFLHAKNISAKMWLCPALNMGYLNSAIKDMLSSPNNLFCLSIPMVWRLSWINCLTVFLSILVPLGVPIWLLGCAAQHWPSSNCFSLSPWGCVALLPFQTHLPRCPASWSIGNIAAVPLTFGSQLV